ncbi:hypothetical protein LCGC14_2860480, partial [marine sediment metagenome]
MVRVPRLRLPSPTLPATCNAVAALALVAGLVLSYSQAQTDAARRMAARDPAPEPIAIAAFDRGDHIGPADEVMVLAQIDMTRGLQIAPAWGASDSAVTAYRLLEQGAGPQGAPAGYILLPSDTTQTLRIPAGLDILGEGTLGPIAAINGTVTERFRLAAKLRKGFAVPAAAGNRAPLIVRAFVHGRVPDLVRDRSSPV